MTRLGLNLERQAGRTALFRMRRPVKLTDLERIGKLSTVLSAEPDRFVPFRAQWGACKPVNSNPLLLSLPRLMDFIKHCSLFESCPGSSDAKLWANEVTDSLLMTEELSRMKVPGGNIKIAVLDTGFDLAGNRDLMASRDFKVVQAFPHTSPVGQDSVGHGTAVAGLIGARGGIGMAPSAALSVYSISPPDEPGASASDISDAITRACKDGNEVINLSLGSELEESTGVRFLSDRKDVLAELEKRGCLVVKAGGNAGYREHFKSDGSASALLTAEAISKSGGVADFSSVGEIPAPGDRIFTLASSQEAGPSHDRCGGGQFISGTSFAAPIVAGIAANVISVLKTAKAYSRLKGSEKLTLVRTILRESIAGPSVSGLRAVLLAEAWTKDSSTKNTNITWNGVKESVQKGCTEKLPGCRKLDSCSKDLNGCLQRVKRHLSVCEIPSSEVIDGFLGTLRDRGYPDIAALWTHRLSRNPYFRLSFRFSENTISAFKEYVTRNAKSGKISLPELIADYGLLLRMGVRLPELEDSLERRALHAMNNGSDGESFGGLSQFFGAQRPETRQGWKEAAALLSTGVWNNAKLLGILQREDLSPRARDILLDAMNVEGYSAADRKAALESLVSSARTSKSALTAITKSLKYSKTDFPDGVGVLRKIVNRIDADDSVISNALQAAADSPHDLGSVQLLLQDALHSPKGGYFTYLTLTDYFYDQRLSDAEVDQLGRELMKDKVLLDRDEIIHAVHKMGTGSDLSLQQILRKPLPIRSESLYRELFTSLCNDSVGVHRLVVSIAFSPMEFETKKSVLEKCLQNREVGSGIFFDGMRMLNRVQKVSLTLEEAKRLAVELSRHPGLSENRDDFLQNGDAFIGVLKRFHEMEPEAQ